MYFDLSIHRCAVGYIRRHYARIPNSGYSFNHTYVLPLIIALPPPSRICAPWIHSLASDVAVAVALLWCRANMPRLPCVEAHQYFDEVRP